MTSETPFLNIHSHRPCRANETNVFSLDAGALQQQIPAHSYLSCGIHPWFISPQWEEQLGMLEAYWQQPDTLFVGECGLDPNSPHPLPLQEEVFLRQATWAATHQKPMIIHCVKAFDRLIALYRQLHPSAPWIIHGFRGKPQQLKSLLGVGFLVSFGARFNPETVVTCPGNRFFLETDDSDLPIEQVYQQVAQVRNTDVERLKREQTENGRQLLKTGTGAANP